jgi:hypothetical protein
MTRKARFHAVATVATLAIVALAEPATVFAHGRGHGGRGPVVVVGGRFGGFYPYFGWGFGPYYGAYGPYFGPYAYRPEGGVDLNVAMMAGYGGVDLDVKPGAAEVWVDGKYVAEAKDLDGYPSFLWLKEGVHRVVVYKGGYQRFEEDIEVDRGIKKDLRIRLEKGESNPPGRRPAGQL